MAILCVGPYSTISSLSEQLFRQSVTYTTSVSTAFTEPTCTPTAYFWEKEIQSVSGLVGNTADSTIGSSIAFIAEHLVPTQVAVDDTEDDPIVPYVPKNARVLRKKTRRPWRGAMTIIRRTSFTSRVHPIILGRRLPKS